MSETPIGIGSTVWWRDENSRRYEGSSGPTERGHWREAKITGESPRMWLLIGYAGKLPKNGRLPMDYAISSEQVERNIWLREHRYMIASAVERMCWVNIKDTDMVTEKMDAIAAIVGYEPRAPHNSGIVEP
jgi:hypothetical protein